MGGGEKPSDANELFDLTKVSLSISHAPLSLLVHNDKYTSHKLNDSTEGHIESVCEGEVFELQKWLQARKLGKCFESLIAFGIKTSPPCLRDLHFILEDNTVMSSLTVGKRTLLKLLLNVLLEEDSFWTLVPPDNRTTILKVFVAEEIDSMAQVLCLNIEDLSTLLSGLVPSTVIDEVSFIIQRLKSDSFYGSCGTIYNNGSLTPQMSLGEKDTKATSKQKVHQKDEGAMPEVTPKLLWESCKLMDLCEDKQNGSLVDKIVLKRDGVAKLCNNYQSNSASNTSSKISFERLDEVSHKCYGVFGHKQPILEFLKEIGALSEIQANEEGLPSCINGPGLYAFVGSPEVQFSAIDFSTAEASHNLVSDPTKSTFLVLWPQDDAFTNIHDQNKTTTFFRYLTKLCDQIFICLDEECAQDFLTERKHTSFSRLHAYMAEPEVIQEESFLLEEGFILLLGEIPSLVKHCTKMLVGSNGNAAISTGSLLPQKVKLRPFSRYFTIGDDGLKKFQELQEKYDIKFDKMPLGQQKLFFHNFFQKSEALVEDLAVKLKDINGDRQKKCEVEFAEIERTTLDRRSLEDILRGQVYELIHDLCPSLASEIVPDRKETEISKGMERFLRVTALSVDKINGFLGFEEGLGLRRRICTCLAYYLTNKAVRVSSDDILKCLTQPFDSNNHRVASNFWNVFGLSHNKDPTFWDTSSENVEKLLKEGFESTLLKENGKRTSEILTAMVSPFQKFFKERTTKLLQTRELSPSLRKEAMKREIDATYNSLETQLELQSLSEIRDLIFPKVEHATKRTILCIESCKVEPRKIYLKGEVEDLEDLQVQYNAQNLAITQSEQLDLQENPCLRLHPRVKKEGSFQLPASAVVIGVWLIKNKVLVVAKKHDEDSNVDIGLYNLREEKARIIKSLKKPVKLAVFDESSRLLAIYVLVDSLPQSHEVEDHSVHTTSSLAVFRFDEDYQRLTQAGPQYELHQFEGESKLRHMVFLRGCQKLALLDYSNRIRIYDVLGRETLRSTIQLDTNVLPLQVLSLEKGLCLIVIVQVEGVEGVQILPFISPSYTPLPPVEIRSAPTNVMWEILSLGGQKLQPQLCMLNVDTGILTSYIIVATGREQSLIISEATSDFGKSSVQNEDRRLTPLDYVYFVYDKFPVRSEAKTLDRLANSDIFVLFHCSPDFFNEKKLPIRTRDYLRAIWESLMESRKPMNDLHLLENLVVKCFGEWVTERSHYNRNNLFKGHLFDSNSCRTSEPLGKWTRELICLVPIQIARAEDNDFHVLTDGISLPDEHSRNAQDCAKHIQLGLFDSILNWWSGKVMAISSMGKQSTGKSYTLNHLFGLSFEISGARCTDGCWMTMVEVDGVDEENNNSILYIVLDFEGLGSFERTEQEDMLLSVFNASISGLTIFKTEYRLDRDIEQMFSRFQAGVGLIKGDLRLFKGLFCIANKDVSARDIKSIAHEFVSKLRQIMATDSERNFISMMYDNKFAVLPFPPLGEQAYYTELRTLEGLLTKRPLQFKNGKSFAECMKTVLAKLQLKDWRSLERQEIETRLSYLEAHIDIALKTGRIDSEEWVEEELSCLDTREIIPDLPLDEFLPGNHPLKSMVGSLEALTDVSIVFPSDDAGLKDVWMNELFCIYESKDCVRTGNDHLLWHDHFVDFVAAICERRKTRVLQWVKENLEKFEDQEEEPISDESGFSFHKDDEAVKFIFQANLSAEKLCADLQVCNLICSQCYLKCLSPRNHVSETHSCMGSHKCKELCGFCQEDGESVCGDKMGHPGKHDCRLKEHTCDKPCDLKNCLNCNQFCAKTVGHDKICANSQYSEHLCSAPFHLCGQNCSAFNCRGNCITPHGKAHTVHKCFEEKCTRKCSVTGCEKICVADDHFHCSPSSEVFMEENEKRIAVNFDKFNGLHFCGDNHLCQKVCENVGICKVTTQLVQEGTTNFIGKRSTFSYRMVSEANGDREICSVPIPPFKLEHEGSHAHSLDPRVIHYCDQRCPTCHYFCDQPYGHPGNHNASHGMMRNCHFVADTEEIDVGPRKYALGESGEAEMCDMFCRSLGRGHIHLLPCDTELYFNSVCTHSAKDGRQHQTFKYISKEGRKPMDELTHANYWRTVNWKDPCFKKERKAFAMCPNTCNHSSHADSGKTPPFCSLPLWHDLKQKNGTIGSVSTDGHRFSCNHSHPNSGKIFHLVFLLDESGSMRGKPWIDLLQAYRSFLSTRSQSCKEDIVSVIQYSDASRIMCEAIPIANAFHQPLKFHGGGTCFKQGLSTAYSLIDRISVRYPWYETMLLFLSDGRGLHPKDGVDEMQRLGKDFQGKLSLFTVGFGTKASSENLGKLAGLGNGSYIQSIDGAALKNTFVEVASNLGKRIALVANTSNNGNQQ